MIKRFRKWVAKHNHKVQGYIWIGLGIPTILFWKDSVLWVALMSIYANAEASFSAENAENGGGLTDKDKEWIMSVIRESKDE